MAVAPVQPGMLVVVTAPLGLCPLAKGSGFSQWMHAADSSWVLKASLRMNAQLPLLRSGSVMETLELPARTRVVSFNFGGENPRRVELTKYTLFAQGLLTLAM